MNLKNLKILFEEKERRGIKQVKMDGPGAEEEPASARNTSRRPGARRGKSNQDHAFEQSKKQILESLHAVEYSDKSRKGSVDAPVVELIERINASEDYVTTSSCSGRIVLFDQVGTSSTSPDDDDDAALSRTKAGSGGWVLAEHALVSFPQVKDALLAALSSQSSSSESSPSSASSSSAAPSSVMWIRHEPFILHVQCRNLEAAQALHLVAREAGFRESGLSVGRKKTMLAIRTTPLVLVAPVAINGQLSVSLDHLQALVGIACQMFEQNSVMRAKFEQLFKRQQFRIAASSEK